MFKNRLTLGLLCIASVASAQVGVIGKDTAQQAPAGRYILTAMNDTLYFRPSGGVKKALITRVDFLAALAGKEPLISSGTTAQYWRGDKSWQTLNKAAVGLGNVDNTSDVNKPVSTATASALAGKEPAFSKNTGFNKNFGTTPGTVSEGNHAHTFSSLSSKPSTIAGYGITDFNANADIWFQGAVGSPTYLSLRPSSEIIFDGSGAVNTSIYSTTSGGNIEVYKFVSGTVKMPLNVSASIVNFNSEINYTGKNKVVTADTASGRAVFKIPYYVADKFPDSTHFVIESDYVKARSSGNAFFDTLRVDYSYYNLLRDSIELVLPNFDTLLTNETYFNITFFGSDDNDSLFKYVVDTVIYDNYIYADSGKIDSLPTSYISSILYFSDTVYYYSESSHVTYASNYMSSDHHRTPFRLPNKNSPLKTFNLVYKPKEHKYYIR